MNQICDETRRRRLFRQGLCTLAAALLVAITVPAQAQCPGTDLAAELAAFPATGAGSAGAAVSGDFTGSSDSFDEPGLPCWAGPAGLVEEVYSLTPTQPGGLFLRFDTRGSAVGADLTILGDCSGSAVCEPGRSVDAPAASQSSCLFLAEGETTHVLVTPADGGQLGPFQLRMATCAPDATGCGDGVLDVGEECDDGNTVDDDGCTNQCESRTPDGCGDGVESEDEACDDGNDVDDDGCSNSCALNPARLGCGATTLVSGLGGDAGYGAAGLAAGDDGSSDAIDLTAAFPSGLDFYGTTYSSFYVNINGNVTFAGPVDSYTPDPFPIAAQPMIAPFWGDVDTRGVGPIDNTIYWHIDAASGRVIVTWNEVGYYDSNTDASNTFQLILTSREDVAPGAFDVEFRYACLGWLTGDSSGGAGGFGGTEAQAGFDAGNGQDFVTLPGSLSSAVIDIRDTSNVDEPGVWRWSIRGGDVIPASCGDGNDDDGEQCDDGGNANGDGCDSECFLEECGNGRLQAGEACDDGNLDDGDGCSAACTVEAAVPVCGNGDVEDGEECDDVALPTAACDVDCTLAVCGDGLLNRAAGEVCEDGNQSDGDGCDSACQFEVSPRCGDGVEDPGEQCDDGNGDNGDGCDEFCRLEPELRCELNGALEPGEACDDGNTAVGDGCDDACQVEAGYRCVIVWSPAAVASSVCTLVDCEQPVCGDGVQQAGEACDAPGLPTGDCDIDCTAPQCGDGLLNSAAGEECEDGNQTDGDGCSAQCQVETTPQPTNVCGDGDLDPASEECDDTALPTAECDADCTLAVCGDGVLNTLAGEECEDGNQTDGDGCSAQCQVETTPQPTNVCGDGDLDPASEECDDTALPTAECDADCTLAVCGDGVLNTLAGEECEDGNQTDGDGCSAQCLNETKPRPIETDAAGGDEEAPPEVEISGGACSAAPGSGTASFPSVFVVLVAVGLWALRRRSSRGLRPARVLGATLAVVLLAGAAPASAQTLDVQRFRPSPFEGDLFVVGKADTASPFAWSMGLFANYQNDPLAVRITGGDRNTIIQKVVEHQLTFDFLAAAYVTDWFAVGLDLPIIGWQDGDDLSGYPASRSSGLGDIRLLPKFRVLRVGDGLFTLALLAGVQLPSSQERYMGREEFVFLPGLEATLDFGVAGVSLNVNGNLALGEDELSVSVAQPNGTTALTDVARQQFGLQAGIGAWYTIVPERLDVVAELYYGADLDDIGEAANNALEVGGGLEWHVNRWVDLSVGATGGLTRGVAAPEWRVFAGAIFSYDKEIPAPPLPPDTDRDGLPDPDDPCPLDPEDRDGVEDEDGCPEEDNDKDGVCDPWVASNGQQAKYANACRGSDVAPNDPEDMDGFEDEDGAPDADNDGDGLCDPWVATNGQLDRYADLCTGSDRCPVNAEVFNGVNDEDGCPDKRVEIAAEKIVILQKVLFYFDKTIIKPESHALLDEVVQILLDNPWIMKVRIDGHTDERGKKSYNAKLSRGRAKAVYEYLVSHGVAASRLAYKGYGSSKPIVKNATTEEEHQRNRRVEFIILEQLPPEKTRVEDAAE